MFSLFPRSLKSKRRLIAAEPQTRIDPVFSGFLKKYCKCYNGERNLSIFIGRKKFRLAYVLEISSCVIGSLEESSRTDSMNIGQSNFYHLN